jgi:Flp pilus assembly protein TadD
MPASGALERESKSLKQTLMVALLLASMTLILYWPVKSFDFVYDDHLYVTDNLQVQDGLTLDGIRWSFTAFHAGNWHPLAWLSHMADFETYGSYAGGHHWTSVLIHTVSAILLFFVLSLLTQSPWASALVAALFTIHPIHVESVAWVSERKDVLCGFFWILTMGAYARYVKVPNLRRYLLVLGSFVLGILSKPMAVTLPFVLLLLDYWPLRRFAGSRTAFDRWMPRAGTSGRTNALRLLIEKTPLLLLVAVSCVATIIAQKGIDALWSLEKMPLEVRFANAVVSYVGYLGKTIWPVDLAILYPHAGMPPAWKFATALLLLVSISWFTIRKAREHPYLIVGWLWYLGTLVPVIGIVQVGSQSMADRYTYLPLVGIFIAVAWGAKSLVEKQPAVKHFAIALFFVAVAGLLILAKSQVETWRNSITLFEHALTVTKVNPVARYNIGAHYLERNDCKKAVPHFLEAIEMKKNFAQALHCLGVCASREGNAAGALHYYGQAILIDSRLKTPRFDRGLLLMQQGRLDEAVEDFRQILRTDPAHEAAYTNLGLILLRQGNLGDAETHLREALRVSPRNAEALNNLGLVRMKQGRTEDAIACFQKAREFAPGNTVIEANLKTAFDIRQKDTSGKGSI